jgi:hypothetical protein
MANLFPIFLCAASTVCGTILALNGFHYEAGTTCFWLFCASFFWPSLQNYTGNRAWQTIGWYHLNLVPVFLAAHVVGSHFYFWTYQSRYLLSVPDGVPWLGGIPVFEFLFYSIFTAAVLGIWAFCATSIPSSQKESPHVHGLVKTGIIALWCATALLIVFKPNHLRTQFPVWFCLMCGSSLPFGLAALGVPPFARIMPWVKDVCRTRAFLVFCLLLLPILALWELSAIESGQWVYNPEMLLSNIARISADSTKMWPVDMLYGHANCAIFVFFLAQHLRKPA